MLATELSLGILAGGRASRLGGRDKAWIERGGSAQVVRLAHRFAGAGGKVLVSAKTTWAIIDRAAGRIVRVPKEVAEPFRPFGNEG